MELSRTVLIVNRLGLHARAAVKMVELAHSFDAMLTLCNDDKCITLDSVMGVLLLESAQGQRITINASGADAEPALDAICELIEKKFDEDE